MTPEEFKQARCDLGLTQCQLAEMLGYGAKARISDIEHGKKPLVKSTARLMQAYVDGYRPDDWPV